jgi:hypothetical protein
MYIICFCAALLSVSILASHIRSVAIRAIPSILFGLYYAAYITLLLFTGKQANTGVIYNIDAASFKTALFEYPQWVLSALILFFVFTALILRLGKFFYGKVKYITLFICTVLMFAPQGPFYYLGGITRDYRTADKEREFFETFGIHEYVARDKVKSVPGRDIVVIVLESLETTYLFRGLTPNLDSLCGELYCYKGLAAVPDWTVEAIYSMQAGLPAYFGRSPNSIFNHTTGQGITGLGDVFKSAGYRQVYILPGAGIGGVGKLLKNYHYEVIENSNDYPAEAYPKNGFGPHDRFIFDLALKVYLQNSKIPMALFLNTIDMHGPAARPDYDFQKEVEEFNPFPAEDSVEYVVKSTDYLIGKFVSALRSSGRDPVIIILPDHAHYLNKSIGRNSNMLYLISNTKLSFDLTEKFSHFNIPSALIKAAEITTNAVFTADYYPHGYSFTDKHSKIITLNNTLWNPQGENINLKRLVVYRLNDTFTFSDRESSLTINATSQPCLELFDGYVRLTKDGGELFCIVKLEGETLFCGKNQCLPLSEGVNHAENFFNNN